MRRVVDLLKTSSAGVFFMFALVNLVLGAEYRADLRIRIASGEATRTQLLKLEVSDVLIVELLKTKLEDNSRVSVYVYDQNGQLAGRDDPEEVSSAFEWQPYSSGQYYLLLENAGIDGASVRVSTRKARSAMIERKPPAFATVRVYFATDRQLTQAASVNTFGSQPNGNLTYGYSDVSIPRDHRIGELEGPSILKLEFRSDPERHVVLLGSEVESEAEFVHRLSQRTTYSRNRQILLFIHGFNVSFEDATRRTAQIAYDLCFNGPSVVFSWPSQGSSSPLAYTMDQRNADLSAASLKHVLDVLTSPRGATIHIVAHSMGNRVLVAALQLLAQERSQSSKHSIREIALLAPDIDAELFKRTAKQIVHEATRITLYASSRDGALAVAQHVAGYRRAGQAGSDILVIPEVQTVDASEVDTSLFGFNHAYYADNSTLLSDIYSLIRGESPENRFGLSPVRNGGSTYWRFRATAR